VGDAVMMVRDAGFDKARSAAEQNKFCSATHQKNLRRETENKKKFIFFICFMVRDAGFDKAQSAAEQNKFCSATPQKNLRRETENKKISFSFV